MRSVGIKTTSHSSLAVYIITPVITQTQKSILLGRSIIKKDCPQLISAGLNYGLTVDSDGVKFFEYKNGNFESEAILEGTYDSSTYSNVLLSDNGYQIMYREKNVSTILDVESGQRTVFENLSYINHINGIRPLFITESECTQARLINPLDGQPINVNLLTEYQFVNNVSSMNSKQ